MTMQSAIRARLKEDVTVAALIGARVDYVVRPQAAALPSITLQTIGGDRAVHYKGVSGTQETFIQLDAWAETYSEALALAEASIAALEPAATSNGIRFLRAFAGDPRDRGEQTSTIFIHRQQVDLRVWWKTA